MSSEFVLARILFLCEHARMNMTVSEMARLGGKARAKKLTKVQRQESARKAARARWNREKTKRSAPNLQSK